MASENEVATGLDMVLEELESAVAELNRKGAQALQKGDYKRARQVMDKAVQLTTFQDKVSNLRKEWGEIFATAPPRKPAPKKRTRKVRKRLQGGLKTPDHAYRVPILQALVELGGSGSVDAVLSKVGDHMRDQFNEYDHAPLPSTPQTPRWRNTAQWVRYGLVREGLLAPDSPRGVWQITPEGRRWLAAQQQA